MTTEELVLVLLAVLAGAASAYWAHDWWEIRRLRQMERDLEEWHQLCTPGQQRAWLRQPRHRFRCACRRYGLPFGQVVIDETTDHTAEACWPAAESLSR